MIHIETLEVGPFGTNCYLVQLEGSKVLYIIDPGSEAERIVENANAFPFERAEILLTHPHIDHIDAAGEVARALNIPCVYLHQEDHAIYRSPMNFLPPYFPQAASGLPEAKEFPESPDYRTLLLPGHTPGGAGLLFGSTLFCGDTLFYTSVGRTDLPGGSPAALSQSLRELMKMPDETRVLPGHGPETTIGFERKNNPYLFGA